MAWMFGRIGVCSGSSITVNGTHPSIEGKQALCAGRIHSSPPSHRRVIEWHTCNRLAYARRWLHPIEPCGAHQKVLDAAPAQPHLIRFITSDEDRGEVRSGGSDDRYTAQRDRGPALAN